MPQFIQNNPAQQQQTAQNPMQAMMPAAMANSMSSSTSFDFNRMFASEYRSSVMNAMQTDFIAILQNKGYNILGPYSSFDDMPYSDKKKAYVAIVSEVSINLQKKPTVSDTSRGRYNEEGLMQVGGEMRVFITEPLTKERVMTKRINLSDFNIQKPYVYQKEMQSSGTTDGLLNAALGSGEITDNTDKVLADAINEFYAQSMQKTEGYLSIEEINSYEEDINKLKELKRF